MPTETTKKVAAKKPAKTPRAKKAVVKAVEATAAPEAVVEKKASETVYARGRRKTAIARVKLQTVGTGKIMINGKALKDFFGTIELRDTAIGALKAAGLEASSDVDATVQGGGIRGQAESVRLGIARALVAWSPVYRKTLKKMGFMTRDPRAKERKKPGLRRARRAPQWSKR